MAVVVQTRIFYLVMGRRFQKKGVLNNFPVFSFQNLPHVLAEACITEDFPRSQGGVFAFNIFWEVRSFLCMLCVNLKQRGSTASQLEHGNVPTDFVTPAVTWTWGHHRPAQQKNGGKHIVSSVG